jgi:hypothetical protein
MKNTKKDTVFYYIKNCTSLEQQKQTDIPINFPTKIEHYLTMNRTGQGTTPSDAPEIAKPINHQPLLLTDPSNKT